MGANVRILIVDDEKIVCDMARRCLELEGYEVTTFTDSKDALETLRQESFDIMITDLKMKDVDGMQLLEFVQQHHLDTKVMILTAFATVETAKEAFHKQAFDYFTKPVRIDDLKASVRRALQARNLDPEETPNG